MPYSGRRVRSIILSPAGRGRGEILHQTSARNSRIVVWLGSQESGVRSQESGERIL
ncbi:hypothetical protein V0288_23290 [Pannus brasiliensis CCIBt3594]|uniref:Uncharacterized protein n=1 Tax=Pannus brasiliensis CCIBt3594 TaxID=1427578 RepID=A0AAW9R0N4_9CHRO